MSTYSSFAFEVTGRVQGVFFRACTREKALNLGLVGFVRNTPQGSVAGVAQGKLEGMEVFKVRAFVQVYDCFFNLGHPNI
jgi:acylphosphatase